MVTQEPFIEGESFQVQYVLEDVDNNSEFYPPDFKDFRFVSGPYIYYQAAAYGRWQQTTKKYYLIHLKQSNRAKFIIEAAGAKVNGQYIKSDKVIVEVISKDRSCKKAPVTEMNAAPCLILLFILSREKTHMKKSGTTFL